MLHSPWLGSRCFLHENYPLLGVCVYIPVVPHKAVAEVSRIGKVYRRIAGCESWMSEQKH